MKLHYAMTSILLVMTAAPAFSQGVDHAGCKNDVTVYVDKTAITNEKSLRGQIEAEQVEIAHIHGMNTRSINLRSRLQHHLGQMQQAMQDMHDQKLIQGCEAAAHGAALKTRVSVLEKHQDKIQNRLEQVISSQNKSL